MLSIVIISEKEIEVSGGGEFRFLLLFKSFEVYLLKNVLFLQFKKWKENSQLQQTRHAGGEAHSVSTAYILGARNVIVRVI